MAQRAHGHAAEEIYLTLVCTAQGGAGHRRFADPTVEHVTLVKPVKLMLYECSDPQQ
jgi:hypothetical protein